MHGIPNYMYIHFKNTEALAPSVLSLVAVVLLQEFQSQKAMSIPF